MYEKFKDQFLAALSNHFKTEELQIIGTCLDMAAADYTISKKETSIVPYSQIIPKTVEIYIVSKKISGLSDKTLYLYKIVLEDFFRTVQKDPEKVTANDIRVYLYKYQKEHGISNRSLDGRRTVLSSYFSWMASEEYIEKNPTANIDPIKYERRHKKAMSQLELEKVRAACVTKREKAIVEMLYSTGCRVTELERLNISDVNFETKEVLLFGKGDKHRISYMNAKAEVALKEYLNERKDSNEALFVRERSPHERLKKSGIEALVRKIMERVPDVTTHVTPHIFRHTTATSALDHGMNVVEVSRLLGHNRVETTMEYITTDSNSVKNNHRNCVI